MIEWHWKSRRDAVKSAEQVYEIVHGRPMPEADKKLGQEWIDEEKEHVKSE